MGKFGVGILRVLLFGLSSGFFAPGTGSGASAGEGCREGLCSLSVGLRSISFLCYKHVLYVFSEALSPIYGRGKKGNAVT